MKHCDHFTDASTRQQREHPAHPGAQGQENPASLPRRWAWTSVSLWVWRQRWRGRFDLVSRSSGVSHLLLGFPPGGPDTGPWSGWSR